MEVPVHHPQDSTFMQLCCKLCALFRSTMPFTHELDADDGLIRTTLLEGATQTMKGECHFVAAFTQ